MKHISPLIALAASLAVLPPVHADSQLEREMKQLQDQRNKAIAAANEPINRRYQDSLEQLLKRATQANDLDAALKIREELKKHGSPATTDSALSEFKKYLAGTKWGWYDKAGRGWVRNHTLVLNEDGRARYDQEVRKYEILKRGTFKLSSLDGLRMRIFTVDVKKNEGLEEGGTLRIVKE